MYSSPAQHRCPQPPRHPPLWLEGLSLEQQAAVIEPHPKTLVLAGAGSGKTRVLVSRLGWLLLDQGIPPGQTLTFSFTRKACREIGCRVRAFFQRVGHTGPPPPIRTFHAFAWELVRRHFPLLGLGHYPTLLGDDTTGAPQEAFARFLAASHLPRPQASPLELFRRLRPGARELPDPTLVSLEAAFSAWRHTLGILELDDLMPLALKILETPVGAQLRDQLRTVLVDEFQDIDQVQHQLFERLLGAETGFTLFGDDDQAIYRWRGARPDLIRQYFRAENVRTHLLTTNYRCQGAILEAAGHVLKGDPDRVEKPAHAHHPAGPLPQVFAGPRQALRLAQQLKALLETGYCPEDAAILVRDHVDAREIARALETLNIPFSESLELPGVRLLTFHGSKGLEFRLVALPFLDRGRFPGTRKLARERRALQRRLAEARWSKELQPRYAAEYSGLRGNSFPAPASAALWWAYLRGRVRHLSAMLCMRLSLRQKRVKRRNHLRRLKKILARGQELERWLPVLEEAWEQRPKEEADALAEECRLFYVAMTRARERLLLYCDSREQASELLLEIPATALAWHPALTPPILSMNGLSAREREPNGIEALTTARGQAHQGH